MVDFDNYETFSTLDYSEYGELKAFYRSWGIPGVSRFTELKIRDCTPQEISLGEDRSGAKFYEISTSQKSDLENYGQQL